MTFSFKTKMGTGAIFSRALILALSVMMISITSACAKSKHNSVTTRIVRSAPNGTKPANRSVDIRPRRSAFQLETKLSPRQLVDRWKPFIADAAGRLSLPADWIRAVMVEESGGRTMLAEGSPITSSMGAMGLMQITSSTWEEMREIYRLGNDPYDPHDNIVAGAAFLRSLYWEYGYPGMFAAYNDGPGMIEAHRRLRQSLPKETSTYVLDIATILRTGGRSSAETRALIARLREASQNQAADDGQQSRPEIRIAAPSDNDDDYYGELQ